MIAKGCNFPHQQIEDIMMRPRSSIYDNYIRILHGETPIKNQLER